jgi:nucleoside-diphosphate-sugar epimerase
MRLRLPTADPSTGEAATLQLGLGTIGRGIDAAFSSRVESLRIDLPTDWTSAAAQSSSFTEVFDLLENGLRPGEALSVIWSAGAAGFDATETLIVAERDAFRRLLGAVDRFVDVRPDCDVSIHLISSAGGIYEGQTMVGLEHSPLARRPYAQLKLDQEADLSSRADRIRVEIYRPSSVFGKITVDGRQGLIPTLIHNCLLGRVTMLTGRLDTQRDYVSADDVGDYVALRSLHSLPVGVTISHLVAARPYTVAEVLRMVEFSLRRRVLLSVAPGENAAPITFSPKIRPAGFRVEALSIGIRRVLDEFLGRPAIRP